jgi:acyl carrier protein
MEQRVLEIVGGLAAELGGSARRPPRLDDTLDRDLGISSLERVELLLRLEQAFGVRLPDAVMAEAQTVGSLVQAIRAGAAADAVESRPGPVESAGPALGAPSSTRSLVDVLRWHAERTPDRPHVHLRRDDGSEVAITYGRLFADASFVAAGLVDRGVAPHEPVVLMLRTEEAFFSAFFGALLAHAVPVPVYPPVRADQLLEYVRRQQAIVSNAGARVLVTFPEAARMATLIRGHAPTLETIATVDQLRSAEPAPAVSPAGDASALIQYTSGSTGAPKGVLLSHANLLANIRAIGEGLDVRPDDVCVSWLPLYHDMGLIGAWLAPLYFGLPVSIMSPLAFLARPARWLQAIHAHRGTVSAAPNFAFDLAARKIADEDIAGVHLGTWRLALNGSELVSPDTIDRFTQRFAGVGFRPEAMCPVYGMAESSVGLTMTPLGRRPRVDSIARATFENARRIEPAAPDDPHPLRFVSCGRPLPGHEVRVADANGEELAERREGHIWFRGPSMTAGYYRNPEATAAVMRGGWMDSGDLGYLADGDLFITGRAKDVIIQGGRNVSAQEVEEVVAGVPGIRRGCVAAFGVHDPALGTERLVIVAETRERDETARDRLQQTVTEQVVSALGTPPDIVVIAAPGAVPKTSSGKIRRSAARDAYVRGTLGHRQSGMRQWVGLAAAAVLDPARRAGRRAASLLFTARVVTSVACTLPFLWAYLVTTSSGSRARIAVRRWSRLILLLCGVRPEARGLNEFEGLTSGLVVANHASYIDPIVLMATLPLDLHFVAKRGLTDYPVLGTVIRRGGYVTIERADPSQRLAGADDVVARLEQGPWLAVFPEGTFDRRPRLLPFRLGAFRAAVETGRPIVPVALAGTRDMLPDGTWLFRPARLSVHVYPPLRPTGVGWQEIVRLRDAARDQIAQGCGEPAS